MQAYKFNITISKGGAISLPYAIPYLYGKEVELFIIPKEKTRKVHKTSAKDFVSRWAGFLNDPNFDPEETKYEYLSEKYQNYTAASNCLRNRTSFSK